MGNTRQLTSWIGGLTFALLAVSACGMSTTSTPTVTPSASPSPSETSTPSSTPSNAATDAQVSAVADNVYPACASSSACPHGNYTTCESGHSGSGLYDSCPLTTRLKGQLDANKSGVVSAPDELGGGQDPYWNTKAITAAGTLNGGIAHVILGVGGGSTEKFDLLMVLQGSQFLVDDIYCTGQNPTISDAYAPGWLSRSTCVA
jgi:hypothetical protein